MCIPQDDFCELVLAHMISDMLKEARATVSEAGLTQLRNGLCIDVAVSCKVPESRGGL